MRPLIALALVIPVSVTALLGRRSLTYGMVLLATAVFSLLSPPFGSFRVHIADDVVVMVVYVAVATVVGTLVASRIDLLGRVERQRSALLRSVSHDLRTPLSVIEAATTALQAKAHDEQSARLLQLMSDEARRLDRLVANLLSLSRVDAGALVVVRQEVDIAELIETATSRLHRLFVTSSLHVHLADDLPIIHADYALLDQVITNLVENAARCADDVSISAARNDDGIEIVVDDDGPGIPRAEWSTIFTPIRDSSTAGIGLATCRAVVQAHRGTVAVGDSPAGGARFTVELPIG